MGQDGGPLLGGGSGGGASGVLVLVRHLRGVTWVYFQKTC